MKKQHFLGLIPVTLISFLFLTGCEEDVNTAALNEPPKIAFSINESTLIGVNLGATPLPTITGTVQADAGLEQVTVELTRGGQTEVLQNVSTFDEVSRIIYVMEILPEYTPDLSGIRVSAVDEQGRTVEKSMMIETYPNPAFTPGEGLPGTTVTVTGPDFSQAEITSVFIGDTEVSNYSLEADGTLTLEVPEGAAPGRIIINRAGTYAFRSARQFTVLSEEPKTLVTHNNVTVNAQANRNDEGVVTAFSAEGETFTLAEGLDPEVSSKIDFITTDSGGDDGLDLFAPAHPSWLPGNYFKKDASGDMEWPVRNETKLVHLEDRDEEFFTNATIEDIEALSIEGASTRLELGPDGGQSIVGQIILFQTSDGKKGLLHWKGHDTSGGSKEDTFTFDIKVLE